MLKKLRNKKTARKVWLVLAIIIVPAFVLWGSGSLMRSKSASSVGRARIFGRDIPELELKDAINAVKDQAIMQFGQNFNEIQKYLNLQQQALERLVLLHEAKRHKITASDKEVVDLIESYPFFQRNGQFDNRIYNEMLQYVFRTSARVFEEETRQNIMLGKLYKQVTKDIQINDDDVRNEYLKANQEISVSYIASFPADFAKNILPTEQEIKDYYELNSFQFKQPLSFNLEYISANSEDKIKEAAARLKKTRDLKKVAKDLGLELKETGLFSQIDPIPEIGWSPDVIALVSKLKPGELSPAIHSEKNFFILKLKERKEPYIAPFKDVLDKAKDLLIRSKSEEMAKAKIDSCLKNLKAGPKTLDFAKTAKELGLKYGYTNPFKFGSYIEGIGASDNLWTTALSLKSDDFSPVINMPSGFYIIKVKSLSPIDEKKFASEKNDFTDKVLTQKKQEFFLKYTEDLKVKSRY